MGARVVTAREILDGHVVLDIECLDRVYLSAYVPILQSNGPASDTGRSFTAGCPP